ncbi:MAG: hypothetical protein JWM10_861 [Myxococcaceae bacterium]|nr:hypothetical protein [Myxococcaceae bacterium]
MPTRRLVALALPLLAACGPSFHTVTDLTRVTVVSPVASPDPLVVAGSASALHCPAPARALAGTPVTLRTTGAQPGARVRWSVTAAPGDTRAYRFAAQYDDHDTDSVVASGPEVPFTSVIVGDFTVHAEARNPDGTTAQCDTAVAMLGHGLRVELSWNTQATDVDLHALGDPEAHWFTPQDCYYANRTPDTTVVEEGRRRWLDTDDVDGEGPENIRVDTPNVDRDYQVGVHFYSSHQHHGPTHATVVIYCGEQRVARFERDLVGDRGGSDANDFWHVAAVRFGGPEVCAVRPVQQVTSASQMHGGG